jgi:hypothetical protein
MRFSCFSTSAFFNGEILCPICRSDIGFSCLDVDAFKEKYLGNMDGKPLFNNNEHINKIYNSQVNEGGGKKRRKSKTKSKKSKRREINKKSNKNTKRKKYKKH